jgi:arylsulfatase A-like enzyme
MSQEILNPTEKPNILFKLSDDHTSQAWGIYGGPLVDHVQNKNIKRTYPP